MLILIFIAGRFLAWHGAALSVRRTVGYLLSLLPTVVFAGNTLFAFAPSPVGDRIAAEQVVAPTIAEKGPAGAVPPANPYAEAPHSPPDLVAPSELRTTLDDAEALSLYCGHAPQACAADVGSERERLEALLISMVSVVRSSPDHFATPQYIDIEKMANRNNPVALYQLGMLFNDINSDKKYPLLEKSSAANYGPASFMLGRIDMGASSGPTRIDFYHRAIQQGYDVPEVRIALLKALLDRNTTQDCQEVAEILEQLPKDHPVAVALDNYDRVHRCQSQYHSTGAGVAVGSN